MSQAKVDKRKYEKVHRKEIERKRKIKFVVKCIVAAVIIGAAVGIPMGISIYKSIPKFVGDATVQSFVESYIDDNYSSKVAILNGETTTEKDAAAAFEEALKEETGSEVGVVDVQNVDESMNNDTDEADTTEATEE